MDAIKLIWFESKKQITSFPFIITLVLLTVFSFTQMSEVFHIPVNSESDIQALDRAGERDFIDVSNTDEELKEKTSQYLEQMISAGTISDENAKPIMPMEKINEPVDMKITLSIFAAAILPLTSEAPMI